MPKQTKQTAATETPIVPTPAQPVPAPVESSAEPKKRGRKPKAVETSASTESSIDKSAQSAKTVRARKTKTSEASNAAVATIMLHAKRPSTDYLFFCEEIRPQIMKENPQMSFREVGSEQGRRWKALPQEAKNVYKQRWEADKKRYEEELAIVEKNRAEHPDLFVQKKQRKQKTKSPVKRGMTAFIIFCKEQRPVLRASEPALKFGETGARLGQMWNAMNESQKAKYVALAAEDAARATAEREAYVAQAKSDAVTGEAAKANKEQGDAEPKKRGRKPKSAAAPEQGAQAVAAPVAAPAPAPVKGRKPKAAAN
jgi:hypothetical protein